MGNAGFISSTVPGLHEARKPKTVGCEVFCLGASLGPYGKIVRSGDTKSIWGGLMGLLQGSED